MKETLIFLLIVVIMAMLNEIVRPGSRKKKTKRLCAWHSTYQKRGVWLLDNYNCDECKNLPEPPKGAA